MTDAAAGPEILVLARNPANRKLLAGFLAERGYRPRVLETIEQLAAAAREDEPADLALVDLSGYPNAILDSCRELRERGVPFLLVSAGQDGQRAARSGAAHGASATLTKPLDPRALEALIREMLGG